MGERGGGLREKEGRRKNLDAGVGVSLNLFKGRLGRNGGIGWMDCKIRIDFRLSPFFSFNALDNRSWSKSGGGKRPLLHVYLYRTIYSYFLLPVHPPIPFLPFAFSPVPLLHHVAVVCSIIPSCDFIPQDGGGGVAGFLVRNE